MKSLQESLFDTEKHIEKDLTFGDVYKPIEILYPSTKDIQVIGNAFTMSKLKTVKPLSLDNVDGYKQFDKLLDFLPYVLGKVAELPLEEKFIATKMDSNYISYEFKMSNMFNNYQRPSSAIVRFSMMIVDWKPILQIFKSDKSGLKTVSIKYGKK